MTRRVLLTVLTVAVTIAALQQGTAARATVIEVVAGGLDTPRGVIYDRQTRKVLVAEAGTGGPSLQAGGSAASPPVPHATAMALPARYTGTR